jgi:hypothetical protein
MAIFLATVVVVALAWQPSEVLQVSEIAGTVERIDRTSRVVTLRATNGLQQQIYAAPDVPAFDQLAQGDRVAIRFYDSVIIEATPAARMKPVEDTTNDAQKTVDTPPGGAILQQLRLVVTIDEIDRNNNTVTYHDVSNRRVLRGVQNPKLLESLKAGDVVTITYTRARAASIEKQR